MGGCGQLATRDENIWAHGNPSSCAEKKTPFRKGYVSGKNKVICLTKEGTQCV